MNWQCAIAAWMNIAVAVALGIRCGNDEFPCADRSGCVNEFDFCDEHPHCRDGSDERQRHMSIQYDANQTFCRGRNGHFCALPSNIATRVGNYCATDVGCRSDEFLCTDGSRCVPAENICNGVHNCRDGSDERLRKSDHEYEENETFCRRKHCSIIVAPICVGRICVIQADLAPRVRKFCEEEARCGSDEFPCADGSRCLPASLFCNGIANCRDKSDEPSPGVRRFTYNESASSCQSIHTGRVCSSTGLHPQTIDYCKEGYLGKYWFRCLSNDDIAIPKSNVCNGIFDCPDLSDECLCTKITRPEQCKHCIPRTKCNYSDSITNSQKTLMKNSQESSTYKCKLSSKAATKCDGIPECSIFWDEECNCNIPAEFCRHVTPIQNRSSTAARCDVSGTENGSKLIFGDHICNGKADCRDSGDERGCNATRFYCTDDPLPNILLTQICDGKEDCPNGTDESTEVHFCCNDNGRLTYIPRSMVCDGIQDCRSGSDECQNCIISAFSDDSSLISSKLLLAFVWISSIVALAGGLTVVAYTARDLMRLKDVEEDMNSTSHTKIIKILILNLSISDILVAVYTFLICIKSVELSHGYCLSDRRWRSSRACSMLGAILIIGSEQSVLTMVLIAMQRLHVVMRPFSSPNILRVTTAVLVSWVISIALGLIPLIRSLEDYFVISIMFSENEIFKIIYHDEAEYMINWLSLIRRNTSTEMVRTYRMTKWSKIKNLTAEINPNILVNYKFGYYSSHTVCLPTLFPDRLKDTSWGYTLSLLLINFIAFLFMAVCYIILFRNATHNKALEQSSSHQQMRADENIIMQRKLTRIVFSDFLCWMPICIMGFLQIGGIDIPKDAYLPAGLLIVPINSALNPLLYSAVPEIMLEKFEMLKKRFFRRENPLVVVEMEQL